MNNYVIVTGGAGFIGSNLIELLLKKTKCKIISIDNYSTGSNQNHFHHKRVRYIRGSSSNIEVILKNYNPKKIKSIFHFAEFSRIYQSFKNIKDCFNSNILGTSSVIRFCLKNKIKIIYSATSASLGKNGNDQNLSPYAFTKSKNLEMLENLKKWFNFKYEIIYFYNVYGPRQISTGKMATVIGIFEDCYKKNLPLPIVKPGNQSRRFTHIDDTIEVCYLAWKKNKNRHYSISHKHSFKILEVAKMFNKKIKFLKKRAGERYASALTSMNLSNKVYKYYGKKNLNIYVKDFIKSQKKSNI